MKTCTLVLALAATAGAVTTVPLSKKARGVKGERHGSLGSEHGSRRKSSTIKARLAKTHTEHHSGSAKTTALSVDDDPTNATMTWESDSYVVDLQFGDEKDTYPVIVDTGSSNLALAVKACSCDYGDTDFHCKEISSETIDVVYGSGSWSGVATEPIRIGFAGTDVNSSSVTMAAITTQDEFFTADGFNGIMGLGYPGLVEDYTGAEAEPLLTQLVDAGALATESFSLIFCEDAPTMALGGVDESALASNVSYVSTQKFSYDEMGYDIDEYMYYLVKLSSLTVDGTALDLSETDLSGSYGGAAVDSGTTLLYLPPTAVDALETSIYEILAEKDGWSMEDASMFFAMESYLTDKSDLADFPTLVLDMGGYERVLEPEHYVFKYDDIYIWGVGESTFPIVGDVALNELVVVFDQANNKVGFADATCDSDDDGDDASTSTSTHTHSKSKHHSKSDAADVNLAAAAANAPSARSGGVPAALLAAGAAAGLVAAAVGIRRRRAAAAVAYTPI